MRKIQKAVVIILVILLAQIKLYGQGVQKTVVLNWKGVQPVEGINYEQVKVLCADGLTYNSNKGYTPEYFEKFALPVSAGSCDILVTHAEWEPVSDDELGILTYPLQPTDALLPIIETGTERGVSMAMLTIIPIAINPDGGIIRLKSFQIDLVYIPKHSGIESLKSTAYASHSVLAKGNWYKIQLNKTGIYKLSYADIKAMGVDMSAVTPSKIRLFGNGGGLLPEANNIFRYDDLTENPIQVHTALAGVFAPGDYILFYGTSPDKSVYNKTTKRFEHIKNIYSDFTYYYLNFDGETGLRIDNQEQTVLTPNYTSTGFTEGVFYERDLLNFIKSGREWAGERMDAGNNVFTLPGFTFPNIQTSKQAWVRYRVIAKALTSTNFTIKINSTDITTGYCGAYGTYSYGTDRIESKSFSPSADKINISFQYNGTGSAIGWLDWIELNVQRDLKFTGGQMSFADPLSISPGRVTEFQLQASSPAVTIWEVTDPVHVKQVVTTLQGDICRFVASTDTLRQFIAWDNTSLLTATFTEKLVNQDLHGIASADMLIVTHKDYLAQANRLAEHHRTADGLSVLVATNEQVYNEFSSGSPDILAVRDLARMLYNRPEIGSKLKYLLLFGDGSYDFKDRIPENTNRVLTFQTKESLNLVYSYASDDFYGLLDANEGNDGAGLIDIGIGRFPVNTNEQARIAVDKCIYYATNSRSNMGDWRNKLCFVADDGDANTHFRQVEKQICPLIEKIAPVYNLNKVYIDAFKQESTTTGQKSPDVNASIAANVDNGVLVMSYTGHGGEISWANEGILTVPEIDSWTNYKNMPVFFTATCEFSRYDDPGRMSAGEHVFLNPAGGGIALFTTTRLANSGTNVALTLHFYDTLFSKSQDEYPRFGDAIAYAKNKMSGYDAALVRNFVLLGDPALRMAYPEYNVVTTSINGKELSAVADTISAMTSVEIKGIVADYAGNKLSNFTGAVDVKVYDKVRTLTTLGFEPSDWPDKFTVQDNCIYQGTASVTNGEFTIQFITPRDIDYSYGPGKISYYAYTSTSDAHGECKQLIIGGSGNGSTDNAGPQISLFMDDIHFKDGDITGEIPTLIARLSDESGINTISNSIGHDIVATIDGDNSSSVVLNSFYKADLDSYRSGELNYRFSQLSNGPHSLTLKAWDVFNNSSEATINFVVDNNIPLEITNIHVFPNPSREGFNVEFDVNLANSPIEAYLEVFNMNGMLVSSTPSKLMISEGVKADVLTWDGLTTNGSDVTPGIYLVCVRAGNTKSQTVKSTKVLKVL